MYKLISRIVVGTVVLIIFSHFVPPVITLNHKNDVAGPFQVVGKGEVEVVPNVAQVDAGVQVSRVKTADEAKNRISAVQNNIIAAMKKLGVDEVDIKTTQFSISPEYANEPIMKMQSSAGSAVAVAPESTTGAMAEPVMPRLETPAPTVAENPQSRIVGYNGYANVTVKIRDTKKVSEAVSSLTKAGANQVGQVQFVVDNMDKMKDMARAKAIDDAKVRATMIAKQAGIRLGSVRNVIEDQGYYPMAYDAMAAKESGTVPNANPEIAPGSQTVTATVTLYYDTK